MISVKLILSHGAFSNGKFNIDDEVDFEFNSMDCFDCDSINDWLNHQLKHDCSTNYAELRFCVPELDKEFLIGSFKRIRTLKNGKYNYRWIVVD